jgi:hypothetical protein
MGKGHSASSMAQSYLNSQWEIRKKGEIIAAVSDWRLIAEQFTILFIIASAYKLIDAFFSASTALLNLYLCDNTIIDITLL